jgi:hypothetical protein
MNSLRIFTLLALTATAACSSAPVEATGANDDALETAAGHVACTHTGSGDNRNDHCRTHVRCDPKSTNDVCNATYGKSWHVPISYENRCTDRHDFVSICVFCAEDGTCVFDDAQ